jgi:mRNA interferase RelE/StbE
MADRRFEIRIRTGATAELARLPVATQRRIARAIDALEIEPRPQGSRLLAGRPDERVWRIRVGDYRVLYQIRDAELVVLVIRIGLRSEVYRGRFRGG